MKNVTMPSAKYRGRISKSGLVDIHVCLPFTLDTDGRLAQRRIRNTLGRLRNAVATALWPMWRWRGPITIDLGKMIDRKLLELLPPDAGKILKKK